MKAYGYLAGAAVFVAIGVFLAGCSKSETKQAQTASEQQAPTGASVAEKVDTDTPQTVCPVMGGPINRGIYVDYRGKRIYFCCNACVRAFKKNPTKYVARLEEQGVTFPSAEVQD